MRNIYARKRITSLFTKAQIRRLHQARLHAAKRAVQRWDREEREYEQGAKK